MFLQFYMLVNTLFISMYYVGVHEKTVETCLVSFKLECYCILLSVLNILMHHGYNYCVCSNYVLLVYFLKPFQNKCRVVSTQLWVKYGLTQFWVKKYFKNLTQQLG